MNFILYIITIFLFILSYFKDKSKTKKDLLEYFDIRHETIYSDIDGFCLANSSKFKPYNDRW